MIHLVHTSSRPGGIELMMPLIIRKISSFRCKVFVLRPHRHGDVNVYANTNIKVKQGSNNNFLMLIKFFFYALHNRHDTFHLFNVGPIYLIMLRTAGIRRIVYSIRGTIYWSTPRGKIIAKLLWKIALTKRVSLIANSDFSKSVFMNHFIPKSQVNVIYNPLDTKRFFPADGHQGRSMINIIYAGRFTEGKNLYKWVKVAAEVHSQMPETYFELFGQGLIKDQLEKLIDDLNAKEYIKIHGFRNDIENAYRSADLMLFLSSHESFGNVVVECILCGTPVLAANIPSMQEIFSEFPYFLIESNKDLELQIIEKIESIVLLKTNAQKARENFIQRFSVQQHIEKLISIYTSIK